MTTHAGYALLLVSAGTTAPPSTLTPTSQTHTATLLVIGGGPGNNDTHQVDDRNRIETLTSWQPLAGGKWFVRSLLGKQMNRDAV